MPTNLLWLSKKLVEVKQPILQTLNAYKIHSNSCYPAATVMSNQEVMTLYFEL